MVHCRAKDSIIFSGFIFEKQQTWFHTTVNVDQCEKVNHNDSSLDHYLQSLLIETFSDTLLPSSGLLQSSLGLIHGSWDCSGFPELKTRTRGKDSHSIERLALELKTRTRLKDSHSSPIFWRLQTWLGLDPRRLEKTRDLWAKRWTNTTARLPSTKTRESSQNSLAKTHDSKSLCPQRLVTRLDWRSETLVASS